jgi:hypothetical protein
MSDTIQYGAEWSSAASRERMSPGLQARCAAADFEYERQSAAEARERAARLAQRQEADVVLSIRMAQERGELVDVRKALRDGGVGHTRREFVEMAAARMDLEDAQERGREQARIRKFLAGEDDYGDSTAPTAAEVVEGEIIAARSAEFRAKRAERGKILRQSRALARMDRDSR